MPKSEVIDLIGQYQIIGEKEALEKAAVMVPQALRIQQKLEDLIIVNIDATNAYNNVRRDFIYNILREKSKVLQVLSSYKENGAFRTFRSNGNCHW